MSLKFQCSCGQWLEAHNKFAGKRGQCVTCGKAVQIPEVAESVETGGGDGARSEAAPPTRSEPIAVREYLDPPRDPPPSEESETTLEEVSVGQRMFEALLDPRSIQWMMMIGGGLCVLGLIIWLVSLGVFKDPFVLASVMGIGTLTVLGAGWFTALRTRFHMAGQALTFLGCVVAPLNLWFYHAQGLVTVEGHLWVGGVVCCLLYAATVFVLRDSLFMYAFEAGVTLTLLLLLADLGKITDVTFLSLFFMVIGLASIHGERAFSPSDDDTFTRRKFGLPLFWSGHAQVGFSLLILLGAQILDWLVDPTQVLLPHSWRATLLTPNHLLAGGLWLAATYVYLYSDIVVRKIGFYLTLAGFTLVMAEVTLLFGFDLPTELIIGVLALSALAVNFYHAQIALPSKQLDRVIPPIGLVLSGLPLLSGLVLHFRATSEWAAAYKWSYSTDGAFFVALLVVAVSNRISAYLSRKTNPQSSAIYFFFSAAGVLVAAAGLLRILGITTWSHQAPWMMVIPITYLVASRLWRGHTAERPLGWIAQVATALMLVLVFFSSLKDLRSFVPMEGAYDTFLLGIVFVEATVFYLLSGTFRKHSANAYLAAATACGALWQFLGFFGIDSTYHTLLYAGLGVACLIVARALGLEKTTVFAEHGDQRTAMRGRGVPAFQSGNGILTVAILAAVMQGLAGLGSQAATWLDLGVLSMTVVASALAVVIVPSGTWRSVYTTATVLLAAITFLRLNLLIDLSGWQKLEIFSVVAGTVMLIASHIARFREAEGVRDDTVSFGLWLGSALATAPLLLAFVYHRWIGAGPSLYDEMALVTVTVLMTVTGTSWQTKATTLFGGGLLTFYLIVLVVSLVHRPQVAIGVYLAGGGAAVFAIGIALSIYREKLMELPTRILNREGIFRILSWR